MRPIRWSLLWFQIFLVILLEHNRIAFFYMKLGRATRFALDNVIRNVCVRACVCVCVCVCVFSVLRFEESVFFSILFFDRIMWFAGSYFLISPTRDRTRASWVKAQSPNHWTTREFPSILFNSNCKQGDKPRLILPIVFTAYSKCGLL